VHAQQNGFGYYPFAQVVVMALLLSVHIFGTLYIDNKNSVLDYDFILFLLCSHQ